MGYIRFMENRVTHFAIGRTKTGDQLHKCYAYVDEGKVRYGGCNAHCNNHSHLRPVSGWKGEKAEIKIRPGLFCRKCFGDDAARIVANEYVNATVVDHA
jgi:hypothetical protein